MKYSFIKDGVVQEVILCDEAFANLYLENSIYDSVVVTDEVGAYNGFIQEINSEGVVTFVHPKPPQFVPTDPNLSQPITDAITLEELTYETVYGHVTTGEKEAS